jgi:nucleoside-diphosphate-sugar epimerase
MILVTGAAGRLGGRVVKCLMDRGYDVLGTDRVPYEDSPSEFVEADLCNVEQATKLVADAESVIHMGAIPGPRSEDPYRIFENNGHSTFNIMMAAAARKLRRVVFSSSAFGVGWAPDPRAFVPLYLPLDEAHPMMPFEPYGLSKQIGECIGEMVARSSATSVVSLRFTNVVSPEAQEAFPLPPPTPENPTTLVMWAYADPRDVAEAHVLALEADLKGHEAFMLAQPTTRFEESTRELIAANFGAQVPIRGELSGNESVISTKKSQRVLGLKFRPGTNFNA